MEDTIADLYYIGEYAAMIRQRLKAGLDAPIGAVNRMAELTEKVQRFFDPEYAKFAEECHETRCGKDSR